jgi:hypothetical protein
MAALGIRFRAQLRARWRAWLALAVLAGVLGGLVVAGAAGARRTHGSYGRFLVASNAAHAYVDPPIGFGDDSFPLDRVAKLPQVAHSERTLHLAVISRSRSGRPIFPLGPGPVEYLVPSDGHAVDTIDRLRVVHGRLPDPARANEVIGDSKALSNLGVDVGDTFRIRTITRPQLWADMSRPRPRVHLTANPLTAKWGPLIKLHVVGEAANARVAIDGGQMHLTPAFFDAYGGRQIGAWIEELVIRLRHGAADLPAFRHRVEAIAGKRPYTLFDPAVGRPRLRSSVDLQARALWMVTALAALAAILIVAQSVLRLAAVESRDDPTLRALGMGAGGHLAFAAARAATIAVPAATLTVLIAFVVSPVAPIGWARELEPDKGFAFDGSVIVPGALAVLAVVVGAGMFGAVRSLLAGARHPAGRTGRPARPLRAVRFGRSPAMAAGVRMALAGGSRGPVRATLAAAAVAAVVTVTAFTFAASFRHLLDTPPLYGQTWDYESFSGPAQPPSTVRSIVADRGLTGVGSGADDRIEINGRATGVRAWDNLRGRIEPTVIEGRAPRGRSEIMLGTKTFETAGAKLGGFVTIRARGGSRRMQVVARGVLPSSKENRLGEGAVFSFQTLKAIDPAIEQGLFLMRLRPGPPGAAAVKRLNFWFDGDVAVKPDEVGDFGRVDNMPLYISLLFAVAAAAALAHALVAGIRRRRRDLAILKTLGFTRAQVAAAVAWQATTIVAVGVLIGLPLGVGIGRFAWRLFAEDLGVAPEAVVPIWLAVLVIPAAVLLANLIAVLPGWAAARVRPASVLRTE